MFYRCRGASIDLLGKLKRINATGNFYRQQCTFKNMARKLFFEKRRLFIFNFNINMMCSRRCRCRITFSRCLVRSERNLISDLIIFCFSVQFSRRLEMPRLCTITIRVDLENLFSYFLTKEGELLVAKSQTVSLKMIFVAVFHFSI